MKRILSLGIALVFIGLALPARDGFSADWYEIGRLREYHDSEGNVIGLYYKPCSGDPLVTATISGDISGTPAVREQWMCDPVTLKTPDACEKFVLVRGHEKPGEPGTWVWEQILAIFPCFP